MTVVRKKATPDGAHPECDCCPSVARWLRRSIGTQVLIEYRCDSCVEKEPDFTDGRGGVWKRA